MIYKAAKFLGAIAEQFATTDETHVANTTVGTSGCAMHETEGSSPHPIAPESHTRIVRIVKHPEIWVARSPTERDIASIH
jgi:hypothetical protein